MKVYTIGFTKKSAKDFFRLIQENRVTKIIDDLRVIGLRYCHFSNRRRR
jgi:hypothetical protein